MSRVLPWLLALDMDGTLLDDNAVLRPATIAALARIRGKGHIVSFVTGRGEVDMHHCADMYTAADYLLLNNGAKLLQQSGRKILFNQKISPQVVCSLTEYCLDCELQLYIMLGDSYGTTKMTPGVLQYALETGVAPTLFTAPGQIPVEKVETFMSSGDAEAVSRFIQTAALPLRCVPSEPGCCDILPDDGGKWCGVKRLAAQLNIPVTRILAAGNYTNDVDMLRGAGVSVAVANALPSVKAAADYVTKRSNNENVALALEQLLCELEREDRGANGDS